MVIDDKELQVKKQANVNGTICTLSYHASLKVWFVCKDTKVIHVDSSAYLASSAYGKLIEECLNQPLRVVTIVDGSIVEA